MEEMIASTQDCNSCGVAMVGYATDGQKIAELVPYCPHLGLCSDCEVEMERLWGDTVIGMGCEICEEDRREAHLEAIAEQNWEIRQEGESDEWTDGL